MKKKQALLICMASVFILTCCSEQQEGTNPENVLNVDTETPDVEIDLSLSSLYSEEQIKQIEDFEQAKLRFKDLSVEQYKQEYGPVAQYADSVSYSPYDATNIDTIRNRVTLTDEQHELFKKNSFVVLQNEKFDTFFQGFVDLYSADMPLYLSVDALLDAIHLSFDRMLMDLEFFILSDLLDSMLGKMSGQLSKTTDSGQEEIVQTYDDVAVYLCVAKSLLKGEKQSCQRGIDDRVTAYLTLVEAGAPASVSIFGKMVDEDFSQFKPRGHYTKKEALKKYFRAMMWIQRIGLDFSSYNRHARLSFALSELLKTSGAQTQYDQMNEVIELLVGLSDSLNAPGFYEVAVESGISSVEDFKDKVRVQEFAQTVAQANAGKQRINSAIMARDFSLGPDEFTALPPMFHFMGQRFIVDSFVFTNVTYDRVKEPKKRYMASPLDTWAVLGNREAVALLDSELNEYQYQSNLAALDYLITTYQDEFWQTSFYNSWLAALMELDKDVTGAQFPETMKTQSWQHRMLSAQLGSWAHLRHDTLLYAKPSYSMTDCEYPDAWVDPYPKFYEKIADISKLIIGGFESIGLFDMTAQKPAENPHAEWGEPEEEIFSGRTIHNYFLDLEDVSLKLADIASAELKQQRLSEPQLQFINDLIFEGGMSGEPPFDGWYADILYKYTEDNDSIFDPTIADIHTAAKTTEVLHVGTGHPNLMLITIKTNCQVRAYVGPVLSYHEKITTGYDRLTDERWKTMLKSGEESRPNWVTSFLK